MIALSVLTVGLVTMSQSIASSTSLNRVNRESALASDALRDMMERLDGIDDFTTAYAFCQANPLFDVPGLDPIDGAVSVGELLVPDVGGQLREDLVDPEFGMPRDLNGDGDQVDDATADYLLLPVLLRVRWQGVSGERTEVLRTILADR